MTDREWKELRALINDAMKTLATLPAAVATIDDDPGFWHEVLTDLSGQLYSMSEAIGNVTPDSDPQRMNCTDWVAPNLSKETPSTD